MDSKTMIFIEFFKHFSSNIDKLSTECQNILNEIPDISPRQKPTLSLELLEKMFTLYHDTAFQNLIHLQESSNLLKQTIPFETVSYLMKRTVFERLKKSELTPSDKSRICLKSIGIHQESMNSHVQIFDLAGQRWERRKWNCVLDTPNSKICFVISLAEFDEFVSVEEEGDSDRFEESIEVLQKILERKDIKEIYLIFTQFDLLRRKIRKGIKFSMFNKKFQGNDQDANQVSNFIIETFLNLNVDKKIVKHFIIECCFVRDEIVEVFNTILGRKVFDKEVDPNYRPYTYEELVEIWMEESNTEWKVQVPTTSSTNLHEEIYGQSPKELVIEIWKARPLTKDELLSISEFLDFDDISNMRITCKEWSEILLECGIHLTRPNIELFMKSCFKHVKSLNLQACYLTSDNVRYLGDNRFKSVEYLNLSNNYHLNQDDFSNLFKNEFPKLKYLIMDYCNFTNSSILEKCTFISQLEVLSLKGNKLNDKDEVFRRK